MQLLVLAPCLGWLCLILAFPVRSIDSTSESALQSEPHLRLPIPADEWAQEIDGLAEALQRGGVNGAIAFCLAEKLHEFMSESWGEEPSSLLFTEWESQCKLEMAPSHGNYGSDGWTDRNTVTDPIGRGSARRRLDRNDRRGLKLEADQEKQWKSSISNPILRAAARRRLDRGEETDLQLEDDQKNQQGNQKFELNSNLDLGAIHSRVSSTIQQAGKAGFNAIMGNRASNLRDPGKVKRPPGRGLSLYRPPSQSRPIWWQTT